MYSGQQRVEEARSERRNKTLITAAWLLVALACIAVAVVQHQRNREELLGIVEGHSLEAITAGQLIKDDSADIYSFGGEARDSVIPKAAITRYASPGDVKDDVPPAPKEEQASFWNLWNMFNDDEYKPFYEHDRFLLPGDVVDDVPPLHHRYGPFNIEGLFRDEDHDLTTGETTRGSCCRCIEGAPGKDESEVIHDVWSTPYGGEDQDDVAPAPSSEPDQQPSVEGQASKEDAAPSSDSRESNTNDDGTIPVVQAYSIEEAQPANSTVPSSPVRRLMSASSTVKGSSNRILQLRQTQKLAAEAGTTVIMVSIPVSAQPGDLLKAHGPDGSLFAFAVPTTIPQDRVIEVQLPSLGSSPPADAGNSTAVPMTEPVAAPAGNESGSISSVVEKSSAKESTSSGFKEPVISPGDLITPEGKTIGLGPGMSPPRADIEEACCMCPLYDPDTGVIMAWTHDPAVHPTMDAVQYKKFKENVLKRQKHIEEALGITIYPSTFFLNESTPANETNGNATESNATGAASSNSSSMFISWAQHLVQKARVQSGKKELGVQPKNIATKHQLPLSAHQIQAQVKQPAAQVPQVVAASAQPAAQQTTAAPVQQPLVQQAATRPIAEQAPAQPVVQQAITQPVVEQATAQPVVQQAMAQPVVEQAAAQPAAQAFAQPVPEPVAAQAQPVVAQAQAQAIAQPVPQPAEQAPVAQAFAQPLPNLPPQKN